MKLRFPRLVPPFDWPRNAKWAHEQNVTLAGVIRDLKTELSAERSSHLASLERAVALAERLDNMVKQQRATLAFISEKAGDAVIGTRVHLDAIRARCGELPDPAADGERAAREDIVRPASHWDGGEDVSNDQDGCEDLGRRGSRGIGLPCDVAGHPHACGIDHRGPSCDDVSRPEHR